MCIEYNILILGGDKRFEYVTNYMKLFVRSVQKYDEHQDLEMQLQHCDIIVFPVPFTKDGIHIFGTDGLTIEEVFSKNLKDKKILLGAASSLVKGMFQKRNLSFIDYFEKEELAILNAVPTAEGSIGLMIQETNVTIANANILVTGFGKVAKTLAKKLWLLGGKITIAARNESQLAFAKSNGYDTVLLSRLHCLRADYDIIVNTPNAPIFTKEMVDRWGSHTLFIELASLPGGFDFDTTCYKNIISAQGLPGKVAPKSAGEYIARTLVTILMEERK